MWLACGGCHSSLCKNPLWWWCKNTGSLLPPGAPSSQRARPLSAASSCPRLSPSPQGHLQHPCSLTGSKIHGRLDTQQPPSPLQVGYYYRLESMAIILEVIQPMPLAWVLLIHCCRRKEAWWQILTEAIDLWLLNAFTIQFNTFSGYSGLPWSG